MEKTRHRRNPVVLIHGIDDTCKLFHLLRHYLEERGWLVHGLHLSPNDGEAGIEHLAEQVVSHLELIGETAHALDLVGFSMGGLVARYIVQRLGGRVYAQRLITISSPHGGTWTAWLRSNPGARQMRRDSEFLKDLDRCRQSLNGVQFTSIWTPLDLMILPATSSLMPEARSVRITVATHPLMLRSQRVLRAIEAALEIET